MAAERDSIEWKVGPLQTKETSLSGTIYLSPESRPPAEVADVEYVSREDYVQVVFTKADSLFSDVPTPSNSR